MLGFRRRALTVTAIAVLGVGVAAILLGGAKGTNSQPIVLTATGEQVLSAVRIIRLDDTVARFDSTTGELMRFRGSLDRPNVRSVWVREAPAVRARTSGLLDIQEAAGSLFLVDVMSGDTWILRRRAANLAWDYVEVMR